MKLFGWFRRAPATRDTYYDALNAFNARMQAEGWTEYLVRQPDQSAVVEFNSFYWRAPDFCASQEFHPAMNVANLWWRPVNHEIDGDPILVLGSLAGHTGGGSHE